MTPWGGFAAAGVFTVLVPIVFLGMVGLFIYLAVKGYQDSKRRRAAIAATVAAHQLGHVPEDPARTKLFASPPFGIGDNRRARDVVWGTYAGRPFETFAYSYETSSTDAEGKRTTTTHQFQVTWVPLPGRIPTVRLTSDNSLLRMAAKLGARDLNVESHEFNQRWKVWFQDERSAHAVLTPRMIERFLQPDTVGRGFVFEGQLLFSYAQGASDLADLPLIVGALHQITDLIPPFLFEDAPGSQGASP